MKEHIIKAFRKVPKIITTAATEEMKNRAAYIPLKAQLHLENKIQNSINNTLEEYRDIPQQLYNEFRRTSVHQNEQIFSMSSNQYFNNYYQQQQYKYTATPQPNLAEIMHMREQQTKRIYYEAYRRK